MSVVVSAVTIALSLWLMAPGTASAQGRSETLLVLVAMQKNVTGYQYWFHRQLDFRTLVKP